MLLLFIETQLQLLETLFVRRFENVHGFTGLLCLSGQGLFMAGLQHSQFVQMRLVFLLQLFYALSLVVAGRFLLFLQVVLLQSLSFLELAFFQGLHEQQHLLHLLFLFPFGQVLLFLLFLQPAFMFFLSEC